MIARPNDVTNKKPAEQSAEQRAARSVLFCDVNARRPNAEIRLSGELAGDTVADLGAQFDALIRTGHRQLLVDGRGLSQVSPVCVAVFNRAATGVLPLGGQLTLTGLSDAELDDLFDLAQTDGIMPLVRKTAQFNHHRHLIRALFKHPPARRILFRALVA